MTASLWEHRKWAVFPFPVTGKGRSGASALLGPSTEAALPSTSCDWPVLAASTETAGSLLPSRPPA